MTITNTNKVQHDQSFLLSSRSSVSSNNTQAAEVYGCLRYKDNVLYITDQSIEIGRNSSTSTVHFHVGKNVFVSRKHLQLLHDRNTSDFYLMCLSKNGVFVDDIFQRKSSEPLKLPKRFFKHSPPLPLSLPRNDDDFNFGFLRFSSTFRFPSTNIRIIFESYVDHPFEMPTKNNKTVENSNVIYAPLKISIPEHDKKSPFPSPTGTISAANSCPTSPRQNYQDYHLTSSATTVYSSYNHHKNNNNHLNNSTGNISSASITSSNHNFENVMGTHLPSIVAIAN